jgi:type IV fimbrial biogenesis protein FimT
VVSSTGGSTLVFNGLGRVTGAGITRLDFSYPGGGTCEDAGGTMRCMRIDVSAAGAAKICDPKVSASTDPRKCP